MVKLLRSLFFPPQPPSPEVARRTALHSAALKLLQAESILADAQADRDAYAARVAYLKSFNYQALSREIAGESDLVIPA